MKNSCAKMLKLYLVISINSELGASLCNFRNSYAKSHQTIDIQDTDEEIFVEGISCDTFADIREATEMCKTRCSLEFRQHNIKYIPNGIFIDMHNVSSLSLSQSNLRYLETTSFSGLLNLESLVLDHNLIEIIPGDIFRNLQCLKHLDLGFNIITEIPQDIFDDLTELEFLNLNGNKISSVPMFSCNIKSLKYLNLAKNNIDHLTLPNICNLESLLSLNIDDNNIDGTSECFRNISLELLSLSGNIISDLWKVNCPATLKSLSLSNNRFSSIKQNNFSNLLLLNMLNLSNNNINEISINAFNNLQQMSVLDLSDNRLEFIEYGTFSSLKHLRYLNLSSNSFSYVDPFAFYPLVYLEFVDFSNNHLEFLNLTIFMKVCRNLKSVSINENAFSCEMLSHILYTAKDNELTIPQGKNLHSTNIDGISCTPVDRINEIYSSEELNKPMKHDRAFRGKLAEIESKTLPETLYASINNVSTDLINLNDNFIDFEISISSDIESESNSDEKTALTNFEESFKNVFKDFSSLLSKLKYANKSEVDRSYQFGNVHDSEGATTITFTYLFFLICVMFFCIYIYRKNIIRKNDKDKYCNSKTVRIERLNENYGLATSTQTNLLKV